MPSTNSESALLGTLERIDPRTIWPHEAQHFTPWLVEHIDVLAELLGLELEVGDREASVGAFSLDILAHDVGRNRRVIIENQLGPTDHTHLGQLVTYAAGLEANVVVWIAREFREEHRQALDWLNRGDDTKTEYFGVALEVVRIDDSRPALNLRLVAKPNSWSREALKGKQLADEPSEKSLAYQAFFQALIDELRERHRFTNARAGQPQSWYSFSAGVTGLTFGFSFAAKGRLRADLYINFTAAERNKAFLAALMADKDAIEAQFGEALSWEMLDGKRASRVACYQGGAIDDPADVLERHRQWAVERLLKFKRVVGPRLAKLASETANP
jgi:hypothetical protein